MGLVTADDILGKVALDTTGAIVGVVTSLHIDPKKKDIVGITIDQGLLKPDLFVGIDYIHQFGVDSVMLKTVPYDAMKGKRVLMASGKEAGKVIKVVLKEHLLESIVLERKEGVFSSEKILVKAKYIDMVGETIILKKNARLD